MTALIDQQMWNEKLRINSELRKTLNKLISSKDKLETIIKHSEKRKQDIIKNYFNMTLKIMNEICNNLNIVNDYIFIINKKNYQKLSNLIINKIAFRTEYDSLILKYDELKKLNTYLEKKRNSQNRYYLYTITKITIEEYKKFLENLWSYYETLEDYLENFEKDKY